MTITTHKKKRAKKTKRKTKRKTKKGANKIKNKTKKSTNKYTKRVSGPITVKLAKLASSRDGSHVDLKYFFYKWSDGAWIPEIGLKPDMDMKDYSGMFEDMSSFTYFLGQQNQQEKMFRKQMTAFPKKVKETFPITFEVVQIIKSGKNIPSKLKALNKKLS